VAECSRQAGIRNLADVQSPILAHAEYELWLSIERAPFSEVSPIEHARRVVLAASAA
jgi:hypothetical protein